MRWVPRIVLIASMGPVASHYTSGVSAWYRLIMSLSAHLAAVRLTLPALTATRHYTVLAHTLIGEAAAGFQVRWGPQPDPARYCVPSRHC